MSESTPEQDLVIHRRLVTRRALGFVVALGLTLLLALNGGGYDVVVRDEVAIVIWAVIAVGLAIGVFPRSQLNTGAWIALGGFAALLLLMALSHSWTESDERTTAELARALQYLGIITLAYLSLNRHTWQGAAAGFATAALVIPFFAVASRLSPDLFTDTVAGSFQTDRLSFPLDYWNAVSCWGAMAIAVGLCVSAHAPQRVVRSIALACVPVAALSVYLTYSRFGVAATTIAVLASIAVSRHRWTLSLNAAAAGLAAAFAILTARGQDEIAHATGSAGSGAVITALLLGAAGCAAVALFSQLVDRNRMPLQPARYALAGAIVLALLAAAALHRPIEKGWDEFKNDKTVSVGSSSRLSSLGGTRYEVWKGAEHAFKLDPSRGIGPGTFEFYWSREGTTTEFIRNPHSLYLEQLSELGVFGLLATLAGLGGLSLAAISARRTWHDDRDLAAGTPLMAAFAVFLAYAAIDWMWEVGAVGSLALGGAAVAGAGGLRRAAPWRHGPWVRAGAVVLALMALAAQVPTLVSVQRTRASDSELAAGNQAKALELADDAIRAESWAASPYAMRALVRDQRGERDAARDDIDQAIDRDPENWRWPLIRARIDAADGDRAAVDADLAKVQELAPNSLFIVQGSPFRLGLDQLLSQAGGTPPKARPGP